MQKEAFPNIRGRVLCGYIGTGGPRLYKLYRMAYIVINSESDHTVSYWRARYSSLTWCSQKVFEPVSRIENARHTHQQQVH